MRYNGGKASCAKEIATILRAEIPEGVYCEYWEPFVGAGNVILRPELEGFVRYGSDVDKEMIELLRAVAQGWVPPSTVTFDEYQAAKNDPTLDPKLRAFIGYGCSFGGKYFGGYARSGDRNYALNARNSLLKQRPLLKNVSLCVADYRESPYGKNTLIYCDPPYAGTTNAGSTKGFDSKEFWEWCREQTSYGAIVFVSEFEAPDFAECVWEKQITDGLRRKDGSKMVERLFKVAP